MSIAVTSTKIQVPRRRTDLLSRPRLNSALNDLLDYPFTLISAPAGYGKTCLMIDLAHQASHPACWYSIDPLDRDPKRFLAHLIHAIKREFPDFGQTSLGLLNSLKDPLSVPDQFLTTLVNDLNSTISENYAIFLDDFHLLESSQEINAFISRFGQQMDENTHLVISSRNLFTFPDLPLLIGRKLVKAIDQNDLAFQPKELEAYFQQTKQEPLTKEETKSMIENTAGWITGLLLSKDNKSSLIPGQTKAARITGTNLSSYFTNQVLEKQSDQVRDLMMRTSLFDEFNSTTCEMVLGEPEGLSYEIFLRTLLDQNLFIEQVEDHGTWIRYHHLFRDYLRSELETRFPGETHRLLSSLLYFHLDSEDWEKAFDTASRMNDPELMGDVIETAFSPLFHAGRIKLLADWLEILPEEGYQGHPILYVMKGISISSIGNPSEGLIILSDALSKESVKIKEEYYYRGLLCKATTDRFLGNYDQALNDLEEILDKGLHCGTNITLLAEAQREAALIKYHLGKYDEALFLFYSSIDNYDQVNDVANSANVHSDLGCALMAQGKLDQANNHFSKALNIWENQENLNQLSIALNNIGLVSMLVGHYEKSLNLLNIAEDYSTTNNNPRIRAYILTSKGDVAKSLSNYVIANNLYDEAVETANIVKEKPLVSYLLINQVTCLRCQEELSNAEEILLKIQRTIFSEYAQFEHGLWHLEWAFNHLAQHKLTFALESFQIAHNIFERGNRPFEQSKTILGSCLVAFEQANHIELEIKLNELEIVISNLETIQPLLPEFSRHLKKIQQIASSFPGMKSLQELEYEINNYLDYLPSVNKKIFPQSEILPVEQKLEIQAFGEINVSRNGKRLKASEWIHQKTAREIFFYLLSHPQGVTKDQVGIAFWPDSSPSQLSCQFKNAMYRLRRAIGKEAISFDQETHKYNFNWDCAHEYDVESFQEAIQRAEKQPDIEEKIEEFRLAASIYRHPFAPQLDGVWSEPLRRKLYLTYEKAQLEIAAHTLKKNDYIACLNACQSILEIEPCQELAYQYCMKAYSHLGEIINIVRTYEQCTDSLFTILGIRPSGETISIYKELVKTN